MVAKRESGTTTERDLFVLNCIRRLMVRYRRPPSMREIGDEAGIPSTSTVDWHLAHLADAGMIERRDGDARGAIPVDIAVLEPGAIVTVRAGNGRIVTGRLVAVAA